MPVFERETYVDAPIERVWAFHSDERGLVALTPGWMGLRVEETVGPDGDADPEVLEEGARVVVTIRPFSVGPAQRWTSRIVAREEGDEEAMFRDVMEEGPFPHWAHTHSFETIGTHTRIRDRVEYELPVGPLERPLEAFGALGARLQEAFGSLGTLGLAPMFWYRHRKTKALLE